MSFGGTDAEKIPSETHTTSIGQILLYIIMIMNGHWSLVTGHTQCVQCANIIVYKWMVQIQKKKTQNEKQCTKTNNDQNVVFRLLFYLSSAERKCKVFVSFFCFANKINECHSKRSEIHW